MFDELRLEVNKACNFRCVHCYTLKRGPDAVDVDVFTELIAESGRRGVKALSLTGGEPLMDLDRTSNLVKAGVAAGLSVRLNTNAFYASEQIIRSLVDCGLDEIQISLNGATRESFDSFVRHRGGFDAVVSAIEAAVASGLTVTVRYSLMAANRVELVDTFRLVETLGVTRFKVRALVQVSGIHEPAFATSREELRAVLRELSQVAEGSSVGVEIADDDLDVDLPKGGAVSRTKCKCGAKALFVSADGKVAPCPFLREESQFWLGSLESDDVFELYDTSPDLMTFIGDRDDLEAGNDCSTSCKASRLAGEAQLDMIG